MRTRHPLASIATAVTTLLGIVALSGANACSSDAGSASTSPQADAGIPSDMDGAMPPAQDAAPDVAPGDNPATGCPGGRADCDRIPGNGCEVSIGNDVKNCGACGHDCTALPHVSDANMVTCAAGKCVVPAAACQKGFGHCSANPDDGCEADLGKPETCGACTTKCSGATPLCSNGACSNGCGGSTPTSCSGSCVDTATNAGNCSACGHACAAPTHGQATCAASTCGIACNGGYHACGSSCADNTSTNSCGTSCTPCTTPAHAQPTCNGTSCGFACDGGYHACGGACADSHSVNSCGSSCSPCVPPTHAQSTCDGTSCGFNCDSGYHACGGSCADNHSVSSCGGSCSPCQPPAHGQPTCDGTSCGFNCDAGYHACGSACADNHSLNSCGGSCTPCPSPANATPTCDGATCGFTCNAGYADCDSNPANGCEIKLDSDSKNCGSCGHSCFVGACTAGTCQPGALLNISNPSSLAINGDVFAANSSAILASSKTGSAVRTGAPPAGNISSLAVTSSGDRLLVGGGGYVWSFPRDLTAPRRLNYNPQQTINSLVVVDTSVYWGEIYVDAAHPNLNANEIWHADIDTGAVVRDYVGPQPTISSEVKPLLRALAGDRYGFAWAEASVSSGSNLRTLSQFAFVPNSFSTTHNIIDIQVDPPTAYWTDGTSIYSTNRLYPTSATSLYSSAFAIRHVAADDAGIYFTSTFSNGSILYIKKDGTGMSVLASNLGSPDRIVVDSQAVVWTDPSTSKVMLLAR